MTPELVPFVVPLGAFLLTYLIHSTLLLVGAWSLEEVFQFESVRLRERLWRAALLGGLLTAALQTGLGLETPLARFALSPEEVVAPVASAPGTGGAPGAADAAGPELLEGATFDRAAVLGPVPPSTERAPGRGELPPRSGAPRSPASVEWRLADARGPSEAVEPPAGSAAERAGLAGAVGALGAPVRAAEPTSSGGSLAGARLALGLVAAAALAALAAALLLAVSARRLRGRLAGARELTEGSAEALVRELSRRGRLAAPARLFVAPRLRSPLSSGVLRPAIYLPPRALAELASDELEALLAHELGHVARRDPAWLTLYWLVQRVAFFQPLNRLARRRLSSAAEVLADDWAVRHTGRQLSLAACIARVAGWVSERQRLLTAHMTHERGSGRSTPSASTLGRRIERLLDDERRAAEPRRAWWTPLACSVLGSLAFVAPGVSARALPSEPDAPAETEPEAEPEPGPEFRATEPSPEPGVPAEPAPAEPGSFPGARLDLALPAPVDLDPGDLDPADPDPGGPREPKLELGRELGALDGEMRGLEAELEALREDLSGFEHDPAFARALERLEAHAGSLAVHRDRLSALAQAHPIGDPPAVRP